jgi:uncharacterized membrane protein
MQGTVMSMDFQATVEVATVSPTLQSVAVLAIIVLIRTFLSWSLELEITGKWPWQKKEQQPAAPAQSQEQ